MNYYSKNDAWILEKGDEIIEKKSILTYENLTNLEKLIYCFWVIDYCIKNSGDLSNAHYIFDKFRYEGAKHANELNLKETSLFFSFQEEQMISEFYNYFEKICFELKES